MVFSSRIFYGVPVFMTFTPSERHSGLAIHLYRGRSNDPAFAGAAQEVKPWIGPSTPSLCPGGDSFGDEETAVVDLPEYDVRRLISPRDPLCCVHASQVMTRVVLPSIHGFRMCPDCPHCAKGEDPCMDSFGSNATPMGGAAGRCDAMLGAVESQKADGVLHIHLFIYLQMILQFATLHRPPYTKPKHTSLLGFFCLFWDCSAGKRACRHQRWFVQFGSDLRGQRG